MNESYVECMVARKDIPFLGVLKYIIYIFTGVSLIATMAWSFVFVVPLAAFAALVWLVVPNFELEYEYLYIDREISIDKIMSKQKRKKIRTIKLSAMEFMCPSSSHQLDQYRSRNVKTSDYSSHRADAATWVIMYKDQGTEELIVLEPNEEMLKVIKGVYPRKVIEY
ncbi:MAG: DUF6106 family protein [Lachnospiraceae bacterium]|nr:DUF6106 family protein [Lachnospiraceae bacterium]